MSPPVPPHPTLPSRGAPLRLEPGERVLWAGPAVHRRHTGLLACTGRRVAWVRLGLLGARRKEWPVATIDRVEVKDLGDGPATVLLWARRAATFRVGQRDAKAFVASVASARAQAPFQATLPRGDVRRTPKRVRPGAAARASLEHIERLRRMGALTDAEYQDDRDRFLGQADPLPRR